MLTAAITVTEWLSNSLLLAHAQRKKKGRRQPPLHASVREAQALCALPSIAVCSPPIGIRFGCACSGFATCSSSTPSR